MNTTANRHSNRDSRGRFARSVHVQECETDGLFVYERAVDISHSHAGCPEITTEAYAEGHVAHGWTCGTCTHTDATQWAAMGIEVSCDYMCEGCGIDKGKRAFPTVRLHGVQVRDNRVCRKCRKAGVTPTSSFFLPDPWSDDEWSAA